MYKLSIIYAASVVPDNFRKSFWHTPDTFEHDFLVDFIPYLADHLLQSLM
jgi:hypothetical protein